MYSPKLHSSKNSIKNIIFDFAGVVVECPYEEFIRKAFPELKTQEEITQFSDLIFKSEIWTEYDKGLNYAELKVQLCDLINSKSNSEKYNGTDIDNLLQAIKTLMVPMNDTVILIKQLKHAGMNIYGLTNMPKEIYDHLLNTYAVFNDFSGIISSSYTGLAKPESLIYERLLHDYKIIAKETIFLDDRESNLIKAKELNIKTILFSNAQQAGDTLSARISTLSKHKSPQLKIPKLN